VLKYTLRRILAMIPLLFLVSVMTFGLTLLIPGDPAYAVAGEGATEEQVEAVRERLGLNDPFPVRYALWVSDAVRGDLGPSLYSSKAISADIAERFPVTLGLALAAMLVALVISIPAGIVAAVKRGSWLDRVSTIGASLGLAIPNYWLAVMLITVFAIWQPWLPAVGYTPMGTSFTGWLESIALPAIALGTAAAAQLTRQLRSALIETLQQDYIRTARAKGLRGWTVVMKHAVKNAAVTFVTVAGLQISLLLGGAVLVEEIFGIPGFGQLAVSAVRNQDIPMIQGVVLLGAVVVILANLAVDLTYGYFNPRLRSQ
jgi:peptide/nickel transport system permease protein